MKCPSCGSDDAYVGLSDIDCPNNSCQHFQGGSRALDGVPVSPSLPPSFGRPVQGPPPSPWPMPSPSPALSVVISSYVAKLNNVQVSFVASGDPGNPDKEVSLYFDVGSGEQPCTLSHPCINYIPGVDADGTTVYTTNWLCLNDGVKPTDNWTLSIDIS